MDLNNLSLSELRKLQADITKAIANFEDRKKKAARSELEDKAKEMGFSLAELFGGAPSKRSSRSAEPKYAHPENPSLTWSGRGRNPQWVKEALAAGKKLSDLAI